MRGGAALWLLLSVAVAAPSRLPASLAASADAAVGEGRVVPVPLTVVKGFGIGDVVRRARTSSRRRRRVDVEVWVIGPERPVAGERVTVVPLVAGVEPFSLAVRSATFAPNPFDDDGGDGYGRGESERLPDSWELALEPVPSRAVRGVARTGGRSDEYLFEAVVIAPETPGARTLDPRSLPRELLPEHVLPETVIVAIDLDGDGLPDLLAAEHRLGDWRLPGDGDQTTGLCYERAGGAWRIVDVIGC